jgi:uncharacterized membrane protein
METSSALITNDAVTLGLLLMILGAVFYTSNSSNPTLQKFYSVVPMLLLCYFLPSLLTTFGIVDGEHSKLYYIASRYLLPACLVLLTLSVDLREIARLGFKPVAMVLVGTLGVVIGGPLALLITSVISPELLGATPSEIWRGLATVAGSWIGGGANQAAMYEIFQTPDDIYSVMITVDVLVAEVWMAFLLIGVGHRQRINRALKADASSVDHLRDKMDTFSKSIARIPSTTDLMVLVALGFGATALAHGLADVIAPFIGENAPLLKRASLDSKFFWLIILATFFVIAARVLRAPYFFLAIGSKANIGGAASAPVLAAAFHPSLAPVGVLLAVLGYVMGTIAAYSCALIMRQVSAGF